jgi:uncharacterized protein
VAYRILTFDGGGIRGIFTATILDRLCVAAPDLLARTTLLAGTSTGSIIALALASGLSPRSIRDLYHAHGRELFHDSWVDNVTDLGHLIGAEYENEPLKRVLTDTFGTKRLADLPVRVLVPTFDLDADATPDRPRMWKPKFFHNFEGPDSDGGQLLVDVAMRSTAAPTYFPSYQGFIDGGVVANNPSMAAVAQALHPHGGRQEIASLRLLSLGAGLSPTFIEGNQLDWGIAQWARPLVSLMVDGVMGIADYQCQQILDSHYRRLNPPLGRHVALDDVEAIEQLLEVGSRAPIEATAQWVESTYLRD